MCAPVYDACMDCVKECYAKIGASPSPDDIVLLVGGSSRIVGLHTRLKTLCGSTPVQSVHGPDLLVSRGAAQHAFPVHDGGAHAGGTPQG